VTVNGCGLCEYSHLNHRFRRGAIFLKNLENPKGAMMKKALFVVTICAGLVVLGTWTASFAGINDGLVGYWKFDEGSGNIAHDYSGNGNDGTIYGASWTEGISGYALDFDGVDDYVDVSDDECFDITLAVTLVAWANIEDLSTAEWHTIYSKSLGPVCERNYGIFINNDGYVHLSYIDQYGVNIAVDTPQGIINIINGILF
jgi:hypothetical protein